MFRNYLDKIERDEDVRKNLIELRKLLKTEPGSAAWQRDRQRCLSLMLKLLKEECGIDSWRDGMSGCIGCPVLCL